MKPIFTLMTVALLIVFCCQPTFSDTTKTKKAVAAQPPLTGIYFDNNFVTWALPLGGDQYANLSVLVRGLGMTETVNSTGRRPRIDISSSKSASPVVLKTVPVMLDTTKLGDAIIYNGNAYITLQNAGQSFKLNSTDQGVPSSVSFIHTICKTDSDPLVGLKSVSVDVDTTAKPDDTVQPTIDSIKTAAEIKLREAGLTIVDKYSDTAPKRWGGLEITVLPIKIPDQDMYAYTTDVKLISIVTINDTLVYPAPIWEKSGGIGYAGTTVISSIKDNAMNVVDQFINDYLAANPK